MVFCRVAVGQKEDFAKTETKIAKTSVTAEVCHYTQVSKSDPMLRNSPFFKACRDGEKNDKKSPLKELVYAPLFGL